MIPVEQALGQIDEHCQPLAPMRVPLGEALGLVLSEDIVSDVHSPPFDKALMDGFAVSAHDVADELVVVEEVTAGRVPHHAVTPGTAIRVMTGAPIPDGADAVVMQERVKRIGKERIRLHDATLEPGQNILPMGTSIRKGEVVLRRQRRLRPIELGVLAEIGFAHLNVVARPRVAILATGDELVPVGRPLSAGKIRNSNSTMLTALVQQAGAAATDLGIAADKEDVLKKKIATGLQADVLLLSGGVSAGKLDLVPGILQQLGVREVFHKVQLKPGKPIWFGVHEGNSNARTLVFGLPGNPVSSFVCFFVFVRYCLSRLAGAEPSSSETTLARLDDTFEHRGDRQTYWPGSCTMTALDAAMATVHPLPWHGSADLATLCRSNCFILFPAGRNHFQCGDHVELLCHDTSDW